MHIRSYKVTFYKLVVDGFSNLILYKTVNSRCWITANEMNSIELNKYAVLITRILVVGLTQKNKRQQNFKTLIFNLHLLKSTCFLHLE
jgi:hypothetical protein